MTSRIRAASVSSGSHVGWVAGAMSSAITAITAAATGAAARAPSRPLIVSANAAVPEIMPGSATHTETSSPAASERINMPASINIVSIAPTPCGSSIANTALSSADAEMHMAATAPAGAACAPVCTASEIQCAI